MNVNQAPPPGGLTAIVSRWTDAQRAHLVLRLTLGVNIAAHGLSRIASPGAFADGLARDFQATWLPAWSVRTFALGLPFVELIVGLAILAGLRTRAALAAGGLVIAALTFGSCLRQAWELAGMQLLYALAYYVLAARAGDLRLTLDDWLAAPRASAAVTPRASAV
ncbi:MAG: DoxX family membrane protein [Minicystis sp.]